MLYDPEASGAEYFLKMTRGLTGCFRYDNATKVILESIAFGRNPERIYTKKTI
jgi:hypothetical protein